MSLESLAFDSKGKRLLKTFKRWVTEMEMLYEWRVIARFNVLPDEATIDQLYTVLADARPLAFALRRHQDAPSPSVALRMRSIKTLIHVPAPAPLRPVARPLPVAPLLETPHIAKLLPTLEL